MDNGFTLIPLEKLISRLRTDLKLSARYAAGLPLDGPKLDQTIINKNIRKASLLHYLEELHAIKNATSSPLTVRGF
jgi:hypothetical protein